ncbi:hypothetical protein PV327_000839 [Microctonus hyperodae]|uniref:DDE Tnp4 domain-containing protein n=1 Tax=Microctonus hyperodae TaxID=165561 RepID=A0AA39G730_MICHY|nr:hypothetical protein PV327_000839 [Microctonus hyperodae]
MNDSTLHNINIESDDIYTHNDKVVVRIPKRYIRDGQDPFDTYSNHEFKRRYRFDKDNVKYRILPKIERGLKKINNRGLPIPPIQQLLICLRFYATANFQLILDDTLTVSQPTVSRTVFRVSKLLASLFNEYIKMPNTEKDRIENERLFKNFGIGDGDTGIPNVNGIIDCTHVRISTTKFRIIDDTFKNRKGYFSLNVQTVVGPRMEFLDIVPEWPGGAQDSRIFQSSRIYRRYCEHQLNGILIGDAEYPCLPFLLTPILNPETDEQIIYNKIHSNTRHIINKTYCVWKRRFPCLTKGLTTKLLCTTTIIVACAVLHNMAITFNDVFLEDDELEEEEYEEEQLPVPPPHWQPEDGFIFRKALLAKMFG